MTEHAPEATTLLERYDQLKSTNAELLETLKRIADGTGESWAASEANQAIQHAEEQAK